MKKIVFVIENAFHYAGTEKMCNFMSDAMGDECEITLLSLKGKGEPFYKYKKVSKIINFEGVKYPILKAVSFINKYRPDVVFVITMGRLSVFLALCARAIINKKKRMNIKFVSCEHVSMTSYAKHIKLMKYIALRYYDEVIVLTSNDKEKLFSWGINSKVILNPIDYKNYNKKGKNHIALSIGRLENQKGFDLLLKIWKFFLESNPEWRLIIAGDGSEKDNLLKMADSLGISESVSFVGLINNVDDFIKKADIYLMTSRYEGLPLVLLEAKSWSLPCIAFDCPTGPKEIIKDNEDGFLVPFGDDSDFLRKLNILANDDELRYSFSKATKKTSAKFDEKLIISNWCDLINK